MLTIYLVFVMLNSISIIGLLLLNEKFKTNEKVVSHSMEGCVYAGAALLGPLAQVILIATLIYLFTTGKEL